MLARALRISLIFELALYGLLAHFLGDIAPLSALLAALCVLFGLRAGIIGTTWLFAYHFASPAPRIGFLHCVWMVITEYLAFLLLSFVLMPFERLWMGADRLSSQHSGRVVLLVHGYGANRGCWWWLRRQLEAAGFRVATLNLEPGYASIDDYVGTLAMRINEVCRQAECGQVTLLGHSMGGLVIRAYLVAHGSALVDRLISVGTPHRGSVLAHLAAGANARQMEPDSMWLQALPKPSVPTISIRVCHDNFAIPQNRQRLAGGIDVALPGVGHLALLFSHRTARVIGDQLMRSMALVEDVTKVA